MSDNNKQPISAQTSSEDRIKVGANTETTNKKLHYRHTYDARTKLNAHDRKGFILVLDSAAYLLPTIKYGPPASRLLPYDA